MKKTVTFQKNVPLCGGYKDSFSTERELGVAWAESQVGLRFTRKIEIEGIKYVETTVVPWANVSHYTCLEPEIVVQVQDTRPNGPVRR